jgi:uncharacterized membrane protein YuzA (DUF378 family)
MTNDTLRRIMLGLATVGAVNWGLVGLFKFDLVATLFGGQRSPLSRVVYALVGASGAYVAKDLLAGARDLVRA